MEDIHRFKTKGIEIKHPTSVAEWTIDTTGMTEEEIQELIKELTKEENDDRII